MGVSWAIQIPSQAVANSAIHAAETFLLGSAKGVKAEGVVGLVTAPD